MGQFFQVAIDGPVAAGKGTLARLLAEKLHFLYLDTGAMYRATTLLFLRSGQEISEGNQAALVDLLQKSSIELQSNPKKSGSWQTQIFLQQEDVSEAIRSPEVDTWVSQVAALPQIRKVLVAKQQQLAAHQDIVMEGRDITTRVLPKAQVKIYLTASLTERARRRFAQLQKTHPNLTLAQVKKQIVQRDKLDSSRASDPLQISADAVVVDTTNLRVTAAVDQLVALVVRQREKSHLTSQ